MGCLLTDLWRLFKLVELTQVILQIVKDFTKVHNKVRKGLVDKSSEKLLRTRFVDKSNSNYTKSGLDVFAENAPLSSHNIELLNKLSNNEIEIFSINTISTNCKIPRCQTTAAQNQSQSKTDGLGLMGIVKHFEILENVIPQLLWNFMMFMLVETFFQRTDSQSKITGHQ